MNFSPSAAHAPAIRHIVPRLSYPGGPIGTWQHIARAKLTELLRLDALRAAPLQPRVEWSRSIAGGTVRKVVFMAEEGAAVPAYWCTPEVPPRATFICLQGHMSGIYTSLGLEEDEITASPAKPELAFAHQCLRHGVAALCVESRAFGLRKEVAQAQRSVRSCLDAATRALLLGRTLAGERAFDVMRAVEWLREQPDVDANRIGVLGHSGGGTVAMHAFALLPTLRWCLVSGCFARYADSIATISHCECNAIPGVMQWFDMPDLLAMAAPRPVVILGGKDDPIYPLPSAREGFEAVRRAYRAAGDEAAAKLVAGPGGHRFFDDLAWAALMPLLDDERTARPRPQV